ncbi:MAG TPA: glutathione S-transferase family protein [Sphingomicrobium sp.]|nr:glutathione S-transferase family protein [Sphingomicrobium sp.]
MQLGRQIDGESVHVPGSSMGLGSKSVTKAQRRMYVFLYAEASLGEKRRCPVSAPWTWEPLFRSFTMTITITAFERSPDGGQGLARDTRVRWALEEAGRPYEVRLVSFRAMKESAHLALHPFGQIPTYEEGDLALFESGAIIVHIAERHAGLLPDNADARARAITWMFAALNTVEPPILELANARLLEGDKPWSKERLPLVEGRVRDRLKQLSARLGEADWLDRAFSAGDLMMVSVLLRLKPSGILNEFPNLAAYVARGEARPAYKRAFAAQLAINTGKSPPA